MRALLTGIRVDVVKHTPRTRTLGRGVLALIVAAAVAQPRGYSGFGSAAGVVRFIVTFLCHVRFPFLARDISSASLT
jgi:hypothetical protein